MVLNPKSIPPATQAEDIDTLHAVIIQALSRHPEAASHGNSRSTSTIERFPGILCELEVRIRRCHSYEKN